MSNPSKNSSPQKVNTWITVVIWAILSLFLRWQVIEPRWIPSGSMLPTLQLQDKILVEKIRPRLNLALNKHLNRDDLVVFKPPENLIKTGYDPDSALIKRVVGIPGDLIEIHDGKLFRNKLLIEEQWITEPMSYSMDPIIVPINSLWVLGDNRNNSLDSHFWGPLPEKNVIGTAIFKYWPLNKAGPIRFPHPSKI
tara:strand:- start:20602 stop:21186 length:585 start_codon:yes stop_codon:yes gene_type:complete